MSRLNQHYKTTLPIFLNTREYPIIQRNTTKRLLPREVVSATPKTVALARNILHRQHKENRLYSGSRLSHKGQKSFNICYFLHQPNRFKHLERQGKIADDVKQLSETNMKQTTDAQSHYKEDQLNIDPSLCVSAGRSSKDKFTPLKIAFPPCTAASDYIPDDANSIGDRLSIYDPEKVPNSNGYPIKLSKPIVYKKTYTDEDIEANIKRLTMNDPIKGLIDSYGTVPACVASVPRQTLAKIKKCSAEEVQYIVESLFRFDISQRPPESKLSARSVP